MVNHLCHWFYDNSQFRAYTFGMALLIALKHVLQKSQTGYSISLVPLELLLELLSEVRITLYV